MITLVLAEKPSVARDLGAVLGASQRRGGYLEGSGYRVTWAIGHLVELASPEEIDAAWRRWDATTLPMLPSSFPLRIREDVGEQFEIVRRLLRAREVEQVICATDAGREGELIFRYIYELANARKPVRRLWISSLTQDAIREGFAKLRPARDYDALAAAARARSEADWLVGMNLTRAYTLALGELSSVGRVQTPTLAIVVARDLVIDHFVPQAYREVEARFATAAGELTATYVRRAFDEADGGKAKDLARLPPRPERGELDPRDDADQVASRARIGAAKVQEVQKKSEASRPPLFFDLTELQRAANRLWGFSAAHTLELAQELYERHKLLSYPRTDSRHLSQAVASTLGPVVTSISSRYRALLASEPDGSRLARRFVDDAKVSDHHAIIPTVAEPTGLAEGSDAWRVYDLVCRRLLQAYQLDFIEAVTEVELVVVAGDLTDRYQVRGKSVMREGWRALELREPDKDASCVLPAGLTPGMEADCVEAAVLDKRTRPPPRHTEATLLRAMETAGHSLEAELSDAMRERGLGTPATRASTIETLLSRRYIERQGKALLSTSGGRALIARVHPHVRSPQLTGEWEARLRRIERGEESAEKFGDDVRAFVAAAVGDALSGGIAPRRARVPPKSLPDPRARGGQTSARTRQPSPAR